MALDICPDCNNSVSTQAKSCPKCGLVLKSNKFGLGAVFYAGLMLIGFVLIWGLRGLPYVGATLIFVGSIGFILIFLRALITK